MSGHPAVRGGRCRPRPLPPTRKRNQRLPTPAPNRPASAARGHVRGGGGMAATSPTRPAPENHPHRPPNDRERRPRHGRWDRYGDDDRRAEGPPATLPAMKARGPILAVALAATMTGLILVSAKLSTRSDTLSGSDRHGRHRGLGDRHQHRINERHRDLHRRRLPFGAAALGGRPGPGAQVPVAVVDPSGGHQGEPAAGGHDHPRRSHHAAPAQGGNRRRPVPGLHAGHPLAVHPDHHRAGRRRGCGHGLPRGDPAARRPSPTPPPSTPPWPATTAASSEPRTRPRGSTWPWRRRSTSTAHRCGAAPTSRSARTPT